MRPRTQFLLDAELLGLLATVTSSTVLEHSDSAGDPHSRYMLHMVHGVTGVLLTLVVFVHITLHLAWVRRQIRALIHPPDPLASIVPAVRSSPGHAPDAPEPKRRTAPHLPFPRHVATRYIRLSTRRCRACWACVAACPRAVLGAAILLRHRHAHVDPPRACRGCGTCATACSSGAIGLLRKPASVAPAQD
jgi:2-oxoglutarate ferredoxin oxidoreductase subunit delta